MNFENIVSRFLLLSWHLSMMYAGCLVILPYTQSLKSMKIRLLTKIVRTILWRICGRSAYLLLIRPPKRHARFDFLHGRVNLFFFLNQVCSERTPFNGRICMSEMKNTTLSLALLLLQSLSTVALSLPSTATLQNGTSSNPFVHIK